MNDERKAESSWWKEFLNFLWDGGFKSLIVLVTLAGAVWITIDNDKICKGAPTSNSNSTSLVQPNPICAKYFELVFMIVGGYLGLSIPSNVNSNLKTTKTDSKESTESLATQQKNSTNSETLTDSRGSSESLATQHKINTDSKTEETS